MNIWFAILTVLFIAVSGSMVLIILVQRPAGGGLAGAFGGAGGSGTDTVFGGRVGDALTVMTVIAFVVYLGLAVSLNLLDPQPPEATPTDAAITAPIDGTPPPVSGTTPTPPAGATPIPVTPAPAPATTPPPTTPGSP